MDCLGENLWKSRIFKACSNRKPTGFFSFEALEVVGCWKWSHRQLLFGRRNQNSKSIHGKLAQILGGAIWARPRLASCKVELNFQNVETNPPYARCYDVRFAGLCPTTTTTTTTTMMTTTTTTTTFGNTAICSLQVYCPKSIYSNVHPYPCCMHTNLPSLLSEAFRCFGVSSFINTGP